jgi:hypothetical protein
VTFEHGHTIPAVGGGGSSNAAAAGPTVVT